MKAKQKPASASRKRPAAHAAKPARTAAAEKAAPVATARDKDQGKEKSHGKSAPAHKKVAAGAAPAFSVISGYRSPQTNAYLHEKSAEVSQHSLHMQGRAIDVRVAGVDCASLAAHAL